MDKTSPQGSNLPPKIDEELIEEIILDHWKSEKIDKLGEALAAAQSEMDGAKSESTNPFFGSSYADLHTCIKSSFPFLSKNGLSISQGTDWNGRSFFVTTLLIHKSGQWLRSKIKMPADPNPQKIGSVVTYGRRYGLSAMVGIAQHDDDANSVSKQ